MVSFPDISQFPKSQDGSEPILGASVGLNRILLMLRETAGQANRQDWGLVLINAFTVFRNIAPKDLPASLWIEMFRRDIDLFRLYLTAYLTSVHHHRPLVPIVVYVPNYAYFPAPVLREPSPANAALLEGFAQFSKEFPAVAVEYGTNEATSLWGVPLGTKTMLPHISLAHWVQYKALSDARFRYRYGQPVMLITHCPVDLHIRRRLPNVFLVESYQGTIRTSKEFGRKLSSGADTIPFTPATHQAFGDPVHLSGVATSKQKKILLDASTAHHWMGKPSESVSRDMAALLSVPLRTLTSLRL